MTELFCKGVFMNNKTKKLRLIFGSHLDLINVKPQTNIRLSLIQPSTHNLTVNYKNKLSTNKKASQNKLEGFSTGDDCIVEPD